jgi:hypothetical protein
MKCRVRSVDVALNNVDTQVKAGITYLLKFFFTSVDLVGRAVVAAWSHISLKLQHFGRQSAESMYEVA